MDSKTSSLKGSIWDIDSDPFCYHPELKLTNIAEILEKSNNKKVCLKLIWVVLFSHSVDLSNPMKSQKKSQRYTESLRRVMGKTVYDKTELLEIEKAYLQIIPKDLIQHMVDVTEEQILNRADMLRDANWTLENASTIDKLITQTTNIIDSYNDLKARASEEIKAVQKSWANGVVSPLQRKNAS